MQAGKRIGPDSQMGKFPNIFENISLIFQIFLNMFPQYSQMGKFPNIFEHISLIFSNWEILKYLQKHFLHILKMGNSQIFAKTFPQDFQKNGVLGTLH